MKCWTRCLWVMSSTNADFLKWTTMLANNWALIHMLDRQWPRSLILSWLARPAHIGWVLEYPVCSKIHAVYIISVYVNGLHLCPWPTSMSVAYIYVHGLHLCPWPTSMSVWSSMTNWSSRTSFCWVFQLCKYLCCMVLVGELLDVWALPQCSLTSVPWGEGSTGSQRCDCNPRIHSR